MNISSEEYWNWPTKGKIERLAYILGELYQIMKVALLRVGIDTGSAKFMVRYSKMVHLNTFPYLMVF